MTPPRSFETELTLAQVMLPEDANPRGNVHGGTLMKLADSAGGVCATRHARRPLVTAVIDSMTFEQPVYVGNLVTLPGLIVQQEFPRRDFARAVSLNVAINQLVAALGPYLLGVLHDLSGSYRTSLMACLVLQAAAAILVLWRPRAAVRDA